MSQPDPTPAAPANPTPPPNSPPAPAAPAPPNPPAPKPPAEPAPAAFDPKSLPPEAQAYLRQQVSDADHKARTTARQTAAADAQRDLAAKVAKALGLPGNEPPSPDQLMQQLEAAQDAAWKATTELAVHRLTPHAATLLDSVEFLNAVDAIEAEDGTPEFDTALARTVEDFIARRNLGAGQAPAGPRPDPSQGARGNAPADLATLIAAAQAKGDWREVIRLNNLKLAQLPAK